MKSCYEWYFGKSRSCTQVESFFFNTLTLQHAIKIFFPLTCAQVQRTSLEHDFLQDKIKAWAHGCGSKTLEHRQAKLVNKGLKNCTSTAKVNTTTWFVLFYLILVWSMLQTVKFILKLPNLIILRSSSSLWYKMHFLMYCLVQQISKVSLGMYPMCVLVINRKKPGIVFFFKILRHFFQYVKWNIFLWSVHIIYSCVQLKLFNYDYIWVVCTKIISPYYII